MLPLGTCSSMSRQCSTETFITPTGADPYPPFLCIILFKVFHDSPDCRLSSFLLTLVLCWIHSHHAHALRLKEAFHRRHRTSIRDMCSKAVQTAPPGSSIRSAILGTAAESRSRSTGPRAHSLQPGTSTHRVQRHAFSAPCPNSSVYFAGGPW